MNLFFLFVVALISFPILADDLRYECPYGESSSGTPYGELHLFLQKGEMKSARVEKDLYLACTGKLDPQFPKGVILECGFWQGEEAVGDRAASLAFVQHREPIGTGTMNLSIPFNGKRIYVGCDGL